MYSFVNQSKDGMQQEEKTKDHFLGVMGTDVPLDYLQDFMLQPLVSFKCPLPFLILVMITN